MATYVNKGKKYKVESVTYGGMCIQVNGTTITDCDLQAKMLGYDWYKPNGEFSVYVGGDEIVKAGFEEAYQFAMNEQHDTFWND